MTINQLRDEAWKLLKKTKWECFFLRSCWKCNSAHEHFKNGKWGDWVLQCFSCGHWYYKGKDITLKNIKKLNK